MESRMYAKPADIEEFLNANPIKPYISCEYMHAMGNSIGGMHKYTELEDKYPMYQGGFIWDYIDQSIYKKIVMAKSSSPMAEISVIVHQTIRSVATVSFMLIVK